MDVRKGENARESWWITNLTNKTITIGDLLLLPALKPGKKVDLLHHYTREKISHSIVLTQLVKAGKIRLNKKKLVPNDLPGIIAIADIDEAITPAEENERGTGTGTGSGVHNELTGLQGGDVALDEFYHLDQVSYDAIPSLFPPPAPDLDNVSVATSGVTGDLSFDDSNLPGSTIAEDTYVAVAGIGALGAVAFDASFTNIGDRVGIINASTDITGILNDDVAAHAFSYPPNAFGDADQGELILEINGNEVRTIDLTTAGAVDDGAATSGFTITDDIPCEFSNGDPFAAFQYRTGTYMVDSNDANLGYGWNYARVIHRISGSDTTTNYIDWVVDNNAEDTVFSNDNNFDNLSMSGSSYLSGVRYYTDGDADYDVTIDHGQRNTYIASNAIQFTETNGSVPNVSFNPTVGVETRTETLTDQTFTISSGIRLLNDDITCRTTVNRTIDANEGNDPSTLRTISSILLDDLVDHTTTSDAFEDFLGEGYRKASDIDETDNAGWGSGVDTGPSDWDSTLNITSGGAGYNDGLLICRGRLSYPANTSDISNITNGDFTGITYSYGGQPDYSGATGNRTYIRYFYNSSSRQNFRFDFTFSGAGAFRTIVAGAASGNFLNCELLAPNTTQTAGSPGTVEWKDMVSPYVSEDGIGCYAATYGSSIPDSWGVTLGPRSTSSSGNVILIRVTAASGWTGYISDITCTFL